MTKVLLSVHVLAAILAIGPIAVAASVFPRCVRQAEPGDGTAAFLHRICRGYTVLGAAVPAFGLATGAKMGVLTDAWLIASIILTAIAAALLALAILPGQRRLLALAPGGDVPASAVARLAGLTGTFNLLWAIVVVLMIVRPGSTTGA
ncbi:MULTISPECIES: hypothetical protein [Actinomadura]|uniref:DUF2269 family protein n=1 Tax=Actinomadura madurae TaxID=1993 RepID=A0A1I5URQ7_9ACTN|nr:hypothetical protein [Actinomadura madurae]SFP97935.1 hypothetical protein SAMN04489713_12071 [Actinomadura madurae]SPT56607.1 Uncharacterised protein [Actinomadura madurae]